MYLGPLSSGHQNHVDNYGSQAAWWVSVTQIPIFELLPGRVFALNLQLSRLSGAQIFGTSARSASTVDAIFQGGGKNCASFHSLMMWTWLSLNRMERGHLFPDSGTSFWLAWWAEHDRSDTVWLFEVRCYQCHLFLSCSFKFLTLGSQPPCCAEVQPSPCRDHMKMLCEGAPLVTVSASYSKPQLSRNHL